MGITKDDLAAAVQEYCRAETDKDKAAWLALFAEGATHEDPVGYRTNVGLEAIEEFWNSFQPSSPELWCEQPPIVCGNEVIAIMRVRTGPPDDRREIGPIVDHFVFDDGGRIMSLRAFYNY